MFFDKINCFAFSFLWFWSKLTLKFSFSQSVFVLYIRAEKIFFCFLCVFFFKSPHVTKFFKNHRPFSGVDLTGFDCHRSSKVDQAFVYFFKSFFVKIHDDLSSLSQQSRKTETRPSRETNSNKWQEPVWSAALSQVVVLAWWSKFL